jgi:hypothetical protein
MALANEDLPSCFQEFDDEYEPAATPAEVLGGIFLEAVGGDNPGVQDTRQLCTACREKLGIVNLLGFGS